MGVDREMQTTYMRAAGDTSRRKDPYRPSGCPFLSSNRGLRSRSSSGRLSLLPAPHGVVLELLLGDLAHLGFAYCSASRLSKRLSGDLDISCIRLSRQRFLREARAASAPNHRNVCTIHDVVESNDGELCIAMAHREGRTLKEVISDGPMSPKEAI
jgi:hypothetical protein